MSRPLLISALAGALLGQALAGLPGSAVISPVALAVWLRATPVHGLGPAVRASMTFGFFAAATSESWLPGSVEALTGSFGFGLGVAFALAATHGAIPWLAIGIARSATRRRAPLERVAAASATIFLVESVVSHGGFAIPWVLLGHAQSPDTLGWAPLAAIGGVPLLSAATMAFASGLSEWPDAKGPIERSGLTAIVVALGLLPALHSLVEQAAARSPERDVGGTEVTLLAVQPDLPRSARWRPERQAIHLDRIAAYTERALRARARVPDHVLWPENVVTPGPERRDPRPAIADWATRLGARIVTGVARSLPSEGAPRYSNEVVHAFPDGAAPRSTPKRLGIPFFETATFLGFALEPLVEALGPRFREAPRMRSPISATKTPIDDVIATVLCFEALFPSEVARRRTPRTRVIATLADDAWIPARRGTEQLARYAAFRALEQGLPHVRVAHGGRSVIHDARGRTVDTLPRDAWGSMPLTLPADRIPTIRTEVAIASAASAIVGLGAGALVRHRGRGRREPDRRPR